MFLITSMLTRWLRRAAADNFPVRRARMRIAVVWLFAWFVPAVFATPAEGGSDSAAIQAHDATPCAELSFLPSVNSEGALQRWREVLAQCQRDPVYLARLGQLYLAQGQYGEAADHLERALMFEPDLREARVDYAIALAGVGDLVASAALVNDLLADQSLPASLRAGLLRYKSPQQTAGTWVTRLSTGLRVGHDSNLSGTPLLSSLTLTPPGTTITLPLADGGFVPRPGLYWRADTRIEMRRSGADGDRWELGAGVRAQRNSTVREMESQGADIALERSQFFHATQPSDPVNGYYMSVSAASLRPSRSSDYTMLGLGSGWTRMWRSGQGECQARAGGEVENRRHTNNELLSGRYAGLALSLTCQNDAQIQWLAGLRHGIDRASDEERPGGDQMQTSLRGAVVIPLPAPPGGALLADIEWSRFNDGRGYNPLYDYGRVREVRRTIARLEYQFRLGRGLRAILGSEWLRQQSSLSLFRIGSSGPYGALRWDW